MFGSENDEDSKLDEERWRQKALADMFAHESPPISEEDEKVGEECFEQFDKLQKLERQLADLERMAPQNIQEAILKSERAKELSGLITDIRAWLNTVPDDSSKKTKPTSRLAEQREEWISRAIELGLELSKEKPKLTYEQLAKKIASVLKSEGFGVRGGNKPIAESSIVRHALRGLKKQK